MKKILITPDESVIMIELIAGLNSATYKHPETRAVIEKCKAILEQVPVMVRFLSD